MEKIFEFDDGPLYVTKTTCKNKPALKITFSNVSIHIGFTYEEARDRAFNFFDDRNATIVYRGMHNMQEAL